MQIAYLNGEYLPLEQAQISPMDRGFLFSDGIYEVIPVYGQKLFRLGQHLDRLHNSLKEIRLDQHINIDFTKLLETLIAKNPPHAEQGAYLQITRGPNMTRDHVFPKDIQPTVFAYCQAMHPHRVEQLAKGVHTITLPDLRWQRCDIKSVALLANVLQRNTAAQHQAAEAILYNQNQEVLEGTTSNVFIVKDKTIITTPLSQYILGGITRDLVIELAKQNQIEVTEKTISLSELYGADEVWITSSTKEIVPVLQIDDKTIGNAQPGEIWQQMITAYQAYKQKLIAGSII
ncbi:MAG: D-amino acid aminotransferase [Pseudomonadota bacterium]